MSKQNVDSVSSGKDSIGNDIIMPMKRMIKIFYSWQSDDRDTRKFIDNALNLAKEQIIANADIDYYIEIDRDTKDVVGAVDIKKVILAKIDKADMFICDVSSVGKNDKTGEQINNGNVLFELGYACGKRNVSGHILLANKKTTNENAMPFDIRNLRTKYFDPQSDKNSEKLAKDIVSIIGEYVNKIKTSGESYQNETDRLLASIESGNVVRSRAKGVISKIYDELVALYPGEYRNERLQQYLQITREAIVKSGEIMARLYPVLLAAVEYKQFVVTECAFKELEKILRACSPISGESDNEASFEYGKMVSLDIALIILGLLAEYENWGIITAMKDITIKHQLYGKLSLESLCNLRYPNELITFMNPRPKDSRLDYFPIAKVEVERFADNKDIFNAIIAGDILVYLSNWEGQYDPLSIGVLLLDQNDEYAAPSFISKYKDKESFDSLKSACNYSDITSDRAKIWKKASVRLVNEIAIPDPSLKRFFNSFGIDSEDKIWNNS